jgi:hypothetical protein
MKLKVRAGAGNVEAPAPNDTERKQKKENSVEGIDRTVSGCRSGRVHIRRGAVVVVGTAERKKSRTTRCHEQSCRKKRSGDTLLGYSGRTSLRREQCGMPLKAGISDSEWPSIARQRLVHQVSSIIIWVTNTFS